MDLFLQVFTGYIRLPEAPIYLFLLSYLFVGVWEESVKFAVARLIPARFSSAPYLLSALGFGLFEVLIMRVYHAGFPLSASLIFPVIMHIAFTVGSQRLKYPLISAILLHALWDIGVTLHFSGYLPGGSIIIILAILFGAITYAVACLFDSAKSPEFAR